MPVNLKAYPWPPMYMPRGAQFFADAETIYLDWMDKTASPRLSTALLAIAELRSGISPGTPLYGDYYQKEDDGGDFTIVGQNDRAWSVLSNPQNGFSYVLTTQTTEDAARAFVQYWIRPDNDQEGEIAAALATRWENNGNL